MKTIATLTLMTACLFSLGCGKKAADPETAARAAAEEWLQILDNEDYGGSWDAASANFQRVVTKEEWIELVKGERGMLGKAIKRTPPAEEAPGEPGRFVLRYQTNFEKKPESVETVSPTLEKDGTWRVSAYYVH